MGELVTTKNGQPMSVSFTDGETTALIADLYSMLDANYNGTPSAESEQLRSMLGNLQSGKPLSGGEWAQLKAILTAHGAALEAWRKTPDGQSEGFVTQNDPATGRLVEAALMMPRGSVRQDRDAGPPPSLDSIGQMQRIAEAGRLLRPSARERMS